MSHPRQAKITNVRATALLDKDTASGISTTAGVDMAGYDVAEFDLNIGTAVSGAVLDAWLVESEESNMGNATNINPVGDATLIAITQATASANMNTTTRTLRVTRPAMRYVAARLKTATQNITQIGVTARQYRGTGVTPATVTTDHQFVEGAGI
jgi:hypothetical protein